MPAGSGVVDFVGPQTFASKRLVRPFRVTAQLLVVAALIWTLWFAAVVAGTDYHDAETLRVAAENGNVAAVVRTLNHGVAADALDGPRRLTPLMFAARKNRLDVVRLLLSHGANVNAMCRGHGTPLAIAAANGHADMVKLLIDHGADPNLGSPDGFTPLMHASAMGHANTTRLLIEASVDVNARSQYGDTALMVAMWNRDEEIARLLIQAGAIEHAVADSSTQSQ